MTYLYVSGAKQLLGYDTKVSAPIFGMKGPLPDSGCDPLADTDPGCERSSFLDALDSG